MKQKRRDFLTPYSQKLRREMTREEKHLWYDFLRDLACTVKRQQVIGPYIVDFYIAKARLVIELDGAQHGEEKHLLADEDRDQFLREQGLHVMRYSNEEIRKNFDGVCGHILRLIDGEWEA
ncbi:MAG: DUF559 domain-containing protein [Clostridiales bacterium]|nr:DUF559 domain-containing protein [Clostridiales bacterium]